MPAIFWVTAGTGILIGARRKNIFLGIVLGVIAGYFMEILCNTK
jgi:hypothetical protein